MNKNIDFMNTFKRIFLFSKSNFSSNIYRTEEIRPHINIDSILAKFKFI